MTIQRVQAFWCSNCSDHIVLPRQSHLGKFGGRSDPAKGIWPIRYLCLYCGHPSVVHTQAIHLEELETQGQYQLVRYDFANDQSGSLEHYAIYTKEKISDSERRETSKQAFERVLKPFGLVPNGYGDAVNVSVDAGLRYEPPMNEAKIS